MTTLLLTWTLLAVLTLAVHRALCAACRWAVTVPCAVCHWWMQRYSSTLQCPICREFVHSVVCEPEYFSMPKFGVVTRGNAFGGRGPVSTCQRSGD